MVWSLAAAFVLAPAASFAAPAAGSGAPVRQEGQAGTKEIAGASVTVSGRRSTLELELDDGSLHRIRFEDGVITVDGRRIGEYRPGGALQSAWRSLLAEGVGGTLDAGRLRSWSPPEGRAGRALAGALEALLTPDPAPAPPEAPSTASAPDGRQLSIAPGTLTAGELASRLERLGRALERLGPEAEGAEEALALVVHDDYLLPEGRTVDGNLSLLDGELRLAGRVRGDVLVLDGILRLEPSARVEGDILQVGGEIRREGGRVDGEFLSVRLLSDAPEAVAAPEAAREVRDRVRRAAHRDRSLRGRGFVGGVVRNVGHAVSGLVGVLTALLLLGGTGALCVYFLRPRLEAVAETARREPGRAFGIGLAGQFLWGPLLLVLVVAVVTWLVIPLYLLATVLALLGGYLAMAHLAGELLARERFRYAWLERLRRSNSYYYLFSGLALLLLPFALAAVLHLAGNWLAFLRGMMIFVGVTLSWLAATTGLGAVILSRAGQREPYPAHAAGGMDRSPAGGL